MTSTIEESIHFDLLLGVEWNGREFHSIASTQELTTTQSLTSVRKRLDIRPQWHPLNGLQLVTYCASCPRRRFLNLVQRTWHEHSSTIVVVVINFWPNFFVPCQNRPPVEPPTRWRWLTVSGVEGKSISSSEIHFQPFDCWMARKMNFLSSVDASSILFLLFAQHQPSIHPSACPSLTPLLQHVLPCPAPPQSGEWPFWRSSWIPFKFLGSSKF